MTPLSLFCCFFLSLQNQRPPPKTKQNKTKQNKTKQNKTKQNKTKQNKTKQNKRKEKKKIMDEKQHILTNEKQLLTNEHPTETFPKIDGGTCGCACDWEDRGGKMCGDCCECSPCCGDPCSFGGCLYCCCLFSFCGSCVNAKLFASSLDQDCGIVNHWLPVCCFGCCVAPLVRSNLRQKQNVGENGFAVGDLLVPWCCCTNLCGYCQGLRSVPVEAWDFIGESNRIECLVEPIMFLRPPVIMIQ